LEFYLCCCFGSDKFAVHKIYLKKKKYLESDFVTMANSDNSKSISGSHSVPFSRPAVDAFQDMTAFSPPAESWIIQYPSKREMKNPANKMRVPEEKQLDIGCRQYIESSEIPVKSTRSLGTDDHFKSMVCSKNLLKVCEKVIGTRPGTFNNTTDQIEFYQGHSRFNNRRQSQSLPPSPKLERKSIFDTTVASHNPYFTITKSSDQKESNLSFLTSLFGPAVKREGSKQELDRIDVIPDTSTEAISKSRQPNSGSHRPTANEYREMNMFSPTSM
jgi:hypothetical protein